MAGYSGIPLIQKIGIKPGHRVVLRHHPPSFLKDLGEFPDGAQSAERFSGKANVVVYFAERAAALMKDFPGLAARIEANGMVWIAWPKKASGKQTDLTENIVRTTGLECGLVDVKICAIDETWSGLKFVVRLKDRPADVPKKGSTKK